MACVSSPAGLNHSREPFRFRKHCWSGAHSTKPWKMRHSVYKSWVQCGSHGSRSWRLIFRSMASEPAIQNIESCTRKRTRWSLHETMVLIAAKKKHELQLQKAGVENRLKSREKWEEIEFLCQEEGIERTAQQCRYRWDRMMPIYLKIKDWEKTTTSERSSFWSMKPNDRKAEGFQLVLDREIFDALDEYSTQLICSTTASIDPSRKRGVKDEDDVDETQGAVAGAENGRSAQDSSSIGLHKFTPETSMCIETKQEGDGLSHQSSYWSQIPSLEGDEKNHDDNGPIAIANMIDVSLSGLRVEETTEHMGGISLECEVVIKDDEMKQQGLCTHLFAEDQREETIVIEDTSVLQNKTLTYRMEKDKDSHSEESGNSYNYQYQKTDVYTEETCEEEEKKVTVEEYRRPHASPSVTLTEEICTMTQDLDLPGFDNSTDRLERGMDHNNEERENNDKEHRGTDLFHAIEQNVETADITDRLEREVDHNNEEREYNDKEHRGTDLFHATEQKVETADITAEVRLVHKDCNDTFLNLLNNKGCQEKNGADIQRSNGFSTVDSFTSTDMRNSSDQMKSENSSYQHEYLGTGSVAAHGEVPLMTEGRNTILVHDNESPLKEGIEKGKEICDGTTENDQKLGEGSDAGSPLHQKGEIAGTEQTLKAATKDGNHKPILPIERSEERHDKNSERHRNEFDDDVFRGIQTAISNMTRNTLQSVRKFFNL